MNQYNKPDWVVISFVAIVLTSLVGLGVSEYLSFLTERERREVVKTAIEKNWSVDQIQGLMNSKQ